MSRSIFSSGLIVLTGILIGMSFSEFAVSSEPLEPKKPVDCSQLLESQTAEQNRDISYAQYFQTRQDPGYQPVSNVFVTSPQGQTWTFRLRSAAKYYLSAVENYGSIKKPTLEWIHYSGQSTKVYLIVESGERDFITSYFLEFDLRTKKTKLLFQSIGTWGEVSLVVNKTQRIAVLTTKTYARSRTSAYFSSSTTLSTVICLNSCRTNGISYGFREVGLSPAARSRLKRPHYGPLAGSLLSITFDGRTYHEGESFWTEDAQFFVSVMFKGLEVKRLNFQTLRLEEATVAEVSFPADLTFETAE